MIHFGSLPPLLAVGDMKEGMALLARTGVSLAELSSGYQRAAVVPSPYDGWQERLWPIALMETGDGPVPLHCPGGSVCSCRAPRTSMGCGGCCADLGGCVAEYEREESAPHVWVGDQA